MHAQRPLRNRRHSLRRGLGAVLISMGLSLGVFCGYMFWGTNLAGDRASAQLLERASAELSGSSAESPTAATSEAAAPRPEAAATGSRAAAANGQVINAASTGATPSSTGDASRGEAPSALEHGDLLGVVSIPSIDAEVVVLEGVDASILDQGALGHYPGTAVSGQTGNFAVAGHRTTHGAPLGDIDKIEIGEPIVVETTEGWDVYTLQRRAIVDPDDVSVIAPVPDQPGATATAPSMVLTSCHPKLSAAQRIIAYAELDRHVPRSQGPPAELA